MPIARKKRTSYENFVAECPSCGVESIFNRASDLGSFGRDVACLSAACGKPFRIVGDSIKKQNAMGWHTFLDMLGAAVHGPAPEPREVYMESSVFGAV